MKWFHTAALASAALALFLSAPHLAAQTVAGQISGLVTDPSGSAIAGTSVVVTDIERNVNFRTESNERGFFVVTPLPPGRYRLRAEKQGFRAYNVESLPIATQQKAEVNIALQLGAVFTSAFCCVAIGSDSTL